MQSKPSCIGIFLGTLLSLAAATASAERPDSYNSDRDKLIREMQHEHGFDAEKLRMLMAKAVYRQSIIDAISRPAEAKPWSQYRPIFLTASRIEQGVEFWEQNAALLQQAEQVYGVPSELIVAIIGVETRYGGYLGKYPVLDALTTLAFGYPKRAAFFRSELIQFLLLTREEQVDATAVLGSYAGAMGLPQFIPSSYRAYAVDFDGDGRRDLWNSRADVIGSVAAYFQRHGWVRGEQITTRANGADSRHDSFVDTDMKPSIPYSSLRQAGIESEQPVADDTLVSLVRLDGEQGPEHWLGLNNFYVITRYNHSNLYAMAVYQLSREIVAERNRRIDFGQTKMSELNRAGFR